MDVSVAIGGESAVERIAPISRQIWDAKYRLKTPDRTPIDRTIEASLAPRRRRPGPRRQRPRTMDAALLRGVGGFPLPAGRPDSVGYRQRPPRDAVQLLRHGRHRRRPPERSRLEASKRAIVPVI